MIYVATLTSIIPASIQQTIRTHALVFLSIKVSLRVINSYLLLADILFSEYLT